MTTIILNYCPTNINDDFLKNKLTKLCPDCVIKRVPNADEIIQDYDENSLINMYYDSPFIKTNFIKNNKINFYRVLVICTDKKNNKNTILKLHYIIYPKTIHDKSRFIKYYTIINLYWTIYFKKLIRIMVNPLTTYEYIISYILNLIKTILGDIYLLSYTIVIFIILGIIILSILYKNKKNILKFLCKKN
jgi:hypothetical protein